MRDKVTCSDCGNIFECDLSIAGGDRACPECGSLSKLISLSFEDKVTIGLDTKITGKRVGEKRPFIEEKVGDDFNRDREKYIYREQIIDRENNYYKKLLKDKETGEILRHDEGLLTDHQGFGNAKVSPSKL